MKSFKQYSPGQLLLMPPSLDDWLEDGHLVYFIRDVVGELDLSEIYDDYDASRGGQPAYDPQMMVGLVIYAYCVGLPSSRKIEQATYESVPFRVLAANQHPDHDTICAFRRRHLQALSELFVQVLALCRQAGLLKLGHVALDGTKVQANASKHKAMSYGRMKQEIARLEAEVQQLLERAEAVDAEEDARYGEGNRGDELPEELRFRQKRLERIREAKAALQAQAEAAQGSDEQDDPPAEGEGRPPVEPADSAQRNFTDPDSRIMRDNSRKSFEQCYNCQAAVDDKAQVIVAADVTQDTNDKRQVEPLAEQMRENTGEAPKQLSADAGYFSEANVNYLCEAGIDVYVATRRMKHSDAQHAAPCGRLGADATVKERMDRKLRTKAGRAAYGKRKQTVEPVFGQIKGARGFRQFLLRGLEAVRAEWRLICLGHNLLKLHRSTAAGRLT